MGRARVCKLSFGKEVWSLAPSPICYLLTQVGHGHTHAHTHTSVTSMCVCYILGFNKALKLIYHLSIHPSFLPSLLPPSLSVIPLFFCFLPSTNNSDDVTADSPSFIFSPHSSRLFPSPTCFFLPVILHSSRLLSLPLGGPCWKRVHVCRSHVRIDV